MSYASFTANRELECVPDVWSLSEWSNWLTPTNLARRFDTLFYISFLEKEPTILIDEKEMTHSKVNFFQSYLLELGDLFHRPVFVWVKIYLFSKFVLKLTPTTFLTTY